MKTLAHISTSVSLYLFIATIKNNSMWVVDNSECSELLFILMLICAFKITDYAAKIIEH